MNDRIPRTQMLVALLLVVLVIGGWLWSATRLPAHSPSTGPQPTEPRSDAEPDLSAEQQMKRAQAFEHQQSQQWCEAAEVWRSLKDTSNSVLALEAERNLQMLKSLCHPQTPLVREVAIPPAPERDQPRLVPDEELLKFYPVGKRVRNLSIANLSGKGANQGWLLEGEAYFNYQDRMIVESRVLQNTGGRLTVELLFREVSQTLAVSREQLQLRMPTTPILPMLLPLLNPVEKTLSRSYPHYFIVRRAAEFATILDPKAKHTLTFFARQLRRHGVELNTSSTELLELQSRIDRLEGMRMSVEYVSGLGVTRISIMNDDVGYDAQELERIACSLSLLLDYYIFPGAAQQPGAQWDVRAEDVVGLLHCGDEVEARGRLTLKRESDAVGTRGEQQAVLKIDSGEVQLQGQGARIGETASIIARSGMVLYSPREMLVREARINWQATSDWIDQDNLLWDTQNLRELEANTYYEAEPIAPGMP